MNESGTDKTTPNKCPQCAAALPTGALEGLCPACLLKQGVETNLPQSVPFQPPPLAEVTRLFPQLEILAFIGKGGMGAVYKARQPALDRLVALKILPPQSGGGSGFVERFNREARALARLNHPHIVAVYEFGQTADLPYFIMEFVDGLTLRQLEQAARLSSAEALRIVPQICEALQFAHDEGIVHRDIKPENILIDKKGRVKIADFGIAKIIGGEAGRDDVSATRHALGTPHYMAPEQVETPQTVDHRADIFSLGVVFYEMLTGQLPLGRFAPPSRKVQIDARLDEVVLRALEREPELRFQQVSEVRTHIDTIAASPGGQTPPPIPASPKKFRWSFARAAQILPLFVAAGALIGGIAASLSHSNYYSEAMVLVKSRTGSPNFMESEIASMTSDAVLKQAAQDIPSYIQSRWIPDVSPTLSAGTMTEHLRNVLSVTIEPGNEALRLYCYSKFADEPQNILSNILASYLSYSAGRRGNTLERSVVESPTPARRLGPSLAKRLFSGAMFGFLFGMIGFFIWWAGDSLVSPFRKKPHPDHPATEHWLAAGLPAGFYNWLALIIFGFAALVSICILFLYVKHHAARWLQAPAQSAAAEAQTEPATEVSWSPPSDPGSALDVAAVLTAGNDLMARHQYEDALGRYSWFFNHALEYDTNQANPRITTLLSNWRELGRRFPKADAALQEIRAREAAQLASSHGYLDLFMDVVNIDRQYDNSSATVTVFKTMAQHDPSLARQCFPYVEDELIEQGEYHLCADFVGNPQAAFESYRRPIEMNREMEARMKEMESRLGRTNAVPRFRPPIDFARDNFVRQTSTLIEILSGIGNKTEAENIDKQAVAFIDDPRLHTAVADAEARIARRKADFIRGHQF